MNRRRILLISSLCLLLGSTTSLAGPRTEREMLAIAQTHLAKGAVTRSALSVTKLAEERFYSVYGNDSQGYVIVSRDDSFTPIIGYSDTRFDANSLPCGMQWWLEAISEQMASKASETSFASVSAKRAATFTPKPFFCRTEWDQGDPYNFYAPEFKGNHAPTGCVATAMSQIMKYFTYPTQGKGKGYYTIEGNSSRVTENITGVYEWDKMQDTYNVFDLTDEIRIPVARLMKDAGLATHMQYGSNGSGAYSVEAARGFAYNFGYDSLAMHCYYRQYFDEEVWMQCIYDELGNDRPILYTGSAGANSGHAFVFDGIDEEGRIHVNWGWGGSGNGYYDFADLNPLDEQGKPTSSHYNSEQSMLFGFKCQEEPDEGEKYQSLWCGSKPYKLSVEGKIIQVESNTIYNYHFLWFYGDIGLNFENTDGDAERNTFISLSKQDGVATFFGSGNLTTSKFFTKVKAGHYRVYLASKAVNEDSCQPVRCDGGAIYYELTIADDGSTSLSGSKVMKDNPLTSVKTITSDVRTSNHYIYDLQGRQYSSSDILNKGIYIIEGKKVVKR